MSKLAIIKEFFVFIVDHRYWWLLPIVVALLILSIFVISTGSLAIAPFIYALF